MFTVVEAGRAPAGTTAYRTDVDAGEEEALAAVSLGALAERRDA